MVRERCLKRRRLPACWSILSLVVAGLVASPGCQVGPGPWRDKIPPGGIVAAPTPPEIDLGEPAARADAPPATTQVAKKPDPFDTAPTTAAQPLVSAPPANRAPVAGAAPQVATGPSSPVADASARKPSAGPVVRGQSPPSTPSYTAPPSGGWTTVGTGAGPAVNNYQPAVGAAPGVVGVPGEAPPPAGWDNIPVPPSMQQPPANFADLDAMVQETQTGRFQFGVGVNSDAGVTGQIVIDERNFDITRLPNSWDEVINGTAMRGAGQGFRLEAMPGSQVQRYLASFTEPYLFGFSPISFNISGFYFTRAYTDWMEERLGGRAALGYRLSPDLSVSAALRAENVDISQPRVLGVPELDAVVGSNDLFTARFTLTHDTRDIPFFPTEGHYLEIAYEQAFGEYNFPRGEIDYRKYFLVRERPDGSGRHTLALSGRLGVTGTDVPLFENYFAGGFSTLRGFAFRGASPVDNSVVVGGPFRLLTSAEYFFPLTADDMIKGVIFCDAGTVETTNHIDWDNFRVAPGFGLRLNIPAMGPAPLALDFAFPVAKASTDNTQTFSFFFGFGR